MFPRNHCPDLDPTWPGSDGEPRGPTLSVSYPNCECGRLDEAQLARRDNRQALVSAWAHAAFGHIQATNLAQRGVRMLEEAIEAFQACGGDPAKAHELVDFVFDRPAGELGQELGGLGVTTLALAAAAGLSAEDEELREVRRVFSKPLEHFTARNAAKNAAGFLVVADAQDPVELDDCETCLGQGRIRDGGTGVMRRCLDCGGSGKELRP